MRASECPCSNCSIRACTLAAITSFAVCFCCLLLFWVDGVTTAAVVVVFMGASSLGCCLAVAFECQRGMYIHAERLLAKAGGSKRKGRGISHP